MKRPAKPSCWNKRRSSSFKRSRVISSSAPNGSSNKKTFGFITSERASEARIRMPPESWRGYLSSKPLRPTSSIASFDSWFLSAFGRLCSSAINSTLRATVRHGISVASWNTYPMLLRSMLQVPPVFASRLEAIRSSVDLPQPDGPTTVTNSPALIPNETLSSAFVPSSNVIETLLKDKRAEEDAGASLMMMVSVALTRNKIGHR